jgi:hypothetical protein
MFTISISEGLIGTVIGKTISHYNILDKTEEDVRCGN